MFIAPLEPELETNTEIELEYINRLGELDYEDGRDIFHSSDSYEALREAFLRGEYNHEPPYAQEE